jgi:hypothetical protein
MRRLILQVGVSIDGYVAALDGSHPRRRVTLMVRLRRRIAHADDRYVPSSGRGRCCGPLLGLSCGRPRS